MDNITVFIIGIVVGVYRMEIYTLIKKEWDKPATKKQGVK